MVAASIGDHSSAEDQGTSHVATAPKGQSRKQNGPWFRGLPHAQVTLQGLFGLASNVAEARGGSW